MKVSRKQFNHLKVLLKCSQLIGYPLLYWVSYTEKEAWGYNYNILLLVSGPTQGPVSIILIVKSKITSKIYCVYFFYIFRSSETTAYFWTAIVAVSLIPFIVWGYYLTTWDVGSLQSHCKDIISRHLYKAEI